MVGPEIEAGTLPHPPGRGRKEGGLEQAVLVMPFFWPRIGKKDPELGEGDASRQSVDQFPGFCLDKMTVGELGAFGLAPGAPDPVANQVHPQALALGILGGVAGQEMAMTGPDFQREHGRRRDKLRQLGA